MLTLKSTLMLFLLIVSGTWAQDFWEQTSGPMGGLVNCLAVNQNNVLFAGFDGLWLFSYGHRGRCLYKSADEGTSWESLNIHTNRDVESVAIDNSGSVYIWAGGSGVHKSTDNGNGWMHMSYGIDGFEDGTLGVFNNNYIALGQMGVFISTNGGSSWSGTPLTVRIHSIFIDNEDNLFAGLYSGGIYRSTDYGLSWNSSSQGMYGERVNSIIQYNDSIYFAGTSSGIYRSTNKGLEWNLIPSGLLNVTSFCKGLQGEIYAGTETDGFFCSLNGGRTWQVKNNGLINRYVTTLLTLSSGSVVAGTYGDGMFITSDGGESWQAINQGIISTHITSFLKYKDYLFAGSEQGVIYRSTDRGDTWIRNDSTNTFMPVSAFGKSKKNSLFYSTSFYLTVPEFNGTSWQHSNYSPARLNPGGPFINGIFKSTDEGITWRKTAELYVNEFAAYFDSLSGSEYLLAADFNALYISIDDGENWYLSNTGLQYVEAVGTNSLGYFYVSSPDKILRSTDFGHSWHIIYTGISTVYHTNLAIAGNDYIYAGHDWGKVILSTDHGETWLDRGANLNVNRINSLAVDSLGNVFAGNWWGEIYHSADEGINWRRVNKGMIGGIIFNLFCDNSGNIYVGPFGGGVFRGVTSTFAPIQVKLASPLSGLKNVPLAPLLKWFSTPSAIEYRCQLSSNNNFDSLSIVLDEIVNDTSLITDTLNSSSYYYWRVAARNEYDWSIWSEVSWFKTTLLTDANDPNPQFSYNLEQNYPNPFNPSTTLSYSISEYSAVTIKIFDILGNEIETLVNEEHPAGNYEVTWIAADLPSGVYFYQMRAGVFVETRKMLLLK